MTILRINNEKMHQKELIRWLKRQGIVFKKWINISRLFGIIGGMIMIFQAWILSYILDSIIRECVQSKKLLVHSIILIIIFILRICIIWIKEQVGFQTGQHIRYTIRRQVLNHLQQAGPIWIQKKPVGNWVIIILEQIEKMHDYYASYLPQVVLAFFMPLMIAIAILPISWVAALILLGTAPLIPFFMMIVGTSAIDVNKRNFQALERLGGYFFDRLRGMETIRLFFRGEIEIKNIRQAAQNFRYRTMEVLRLVFLSSSILDFFSSLSIALVAVYFGFSYLGELDFGHYNISITLFAGLFTLILAPEFFQPLRDLGNFYHAKAQAISAADNIRIFLETPLMFCSGGNISLNIKEQIMLEAENLSILSPEGEILAGPMSFKLLARQRVALVGCSGSGKSSLFNLLSGFLPYTGSLRINNIEFHSLNLNIWREMLSWVGQNPHLPAKTIRDNILLTNSEISESKLHSMLKRTRINEFLPLLSQGLDTVIGDQGVGISVGQAQRIAIARALLKPCQLLLLDEPTSGLDINNRNYLMNTLEDASKIQSTIIITHNLNDILEWDNIWVMENGYIIEQGDYNTLYEKRGFFFNLISADREKKV